MKTYYAPPERADGENTEEAGRSGQWECDHERAPPFRERRARGPQRAPADPCGQRSPHGNAWRVGLSGRPGSQARRSGAVRLCPRNARRMRDKRVLPHLRGSDQYRSRASPPTGLRRAPAPSPLKKTGSDRIYTSGSGAPRLLTRGQRLLLLFLQDITYQNRVAALEKVFFHDVNNVIAGLVGSCQLISLETADSNDELCELSEAVFRLSKTPCR